jgi:hypothetical protein
MKQEEAKARPQGAESTLTDSTRVDEWSFGLMDSGLVNLLAN